MQLKGIWRNLSACIPGQDLNNRPKKRFILKGKNGTYEEQIYSSILECPFLERACVWGGGAGAGKGKGGGGGKEGEVGGWAFFFILLTDQLTFTCRSKH